MKSSNKYFVEIEQGDSILSRFDFSFVLGPTSRKTWSNKPDGECVSELFQGQRPILLLPFLGDQYFNFEMFLDHIFPSFVYIEQIMCVNTHVKFEKIFQCH